MAGRTTTKYHHHQYYCYLNQAQSPYEYANRQTQKEETKQSNISCVSVSKAHCSVDILTNTSVETHLAIVHQCINCWSKIFKMMW